MRGLIILAFCVISAQAWFHDFGNIYVHTQTGQLPPKNPLTSDDRLATHKASTFVNFIKIVPQLNPLKLPRLGPYYVDLRDINFSGELYLDNLEIVGINSLKLPQLELRMAPSRVDFNATVPQVSAEVSYELTATLGNQPIKVQGHLTAWLRDLGLSVGVGTIIDTAKLGPVYQVNSADVDIDLDNLKIELSMNQFEEEFRQILVQFLGNPQQYGGVVEGLLTTVLAGINKELQNITAKEIITYLLGPGKAPLRG